MSRFVQSPRIYGISDLLRCYEPGASNMMEDDPSGPLCISSVFDPGEFRPSKRSHCLRRFEDCTYLQLTAFQRPILPEAEVEIETTTTCALIFHDISNPDRLSYEITGSNSEPAVAWRRGLSASADL